MALCIRQLRLRTSNAVMNPCYPAGASYCAGRAAYRGSRAQAPACGFTASGAVRAHQALGRPQCRRCDRATPGVVRVRRPHCHVDQGSPWCRRCIRAAPGVVRVRRPHCRVNRRHAFSRPPTPTGLHSDAVHDQNACYYLRSSRARNPKGRKGLVHLFVCIFIWG